ncbi:hypothetical protein FA15DRAFT_707784 [Coprinopsis marcescibilis]|uniref:Uncharacterized protein n=1 Tax=Coprinopsis marcescibilis TaxID=230819 RepID=A0A5C3KXV9_COPMA|nr:hypothetical protein FA15DRAFT_707784 [Coprinopsis marcescibilis]
MAFCPSHCNSPGQAFKVCGRRPLYPIRTAHPSSNDRLGSPLSNPGKGVNGIWISPMNLIARRHQAARGQRQTLHQIRIPGYWIHGQRFDNHGWSTPQPGEKVVLNLHGGDPFSPRPYKRNHQKAIMQSAKPTRSNFAPCPLSSSGFCQRTAEVQQAGLNLAHALAVRSRTQKYIPPATSTLNPIILSPWTDCLTTRSAIQPAI